jgi:release factor glutamine methyltransferase
MSEFRVIDILTRAATRLETINIDVPRLNAERMMTFITGATRADIYSDTERELTQNQLAEFCSLLERRMGLEPLQYILGETEFYGINLKCDKRALIPRPETEHLVSAALDIAKRLGAQSILDVGCGSGCIGIALGVNLPEARITFLDISKGALEITAENLTSNGLEQRSTLVCSDLFEEVGGLSPFDIVISNPPYIRDSDVRDLHPQIREHEPLNALRAGWDGLDFVRRIIYDVPESLKPGGWLFLELGQGQMEVVKRLIESSPSLQFRESIRDYSGIERVCVAQASTQSIFP